MRAVISIIFGVLFSFWAIIPAFAQVEVSPTLVSVFHDLNADGVFDPSDEAITDWQVHIFDDQFFLLQSVLATTELWLPIEAAYVCIEPNVSWIQTAPIGSVAYPSNQTWQCIDSHSEAVYEFGVYQVTDDSEGELEDDGRVIVQFPEKITPVPTEIEDGGEVLGATDTLVDTGVGIYAMSIVGAASILMAVAITFASKKQH